MDFENLKLEDADGRPVEISQPETTELDDGVNAFQRAMANDSLEDEKRAPRKRTPRNTELTVDEDKPKRGRPRKDAHTTTKVPDKSQKPAVKAQSRTERREGVKGLVQLGSAVCLLLDQRTPADDVAFKADAYTLAANGDAIAEAVVETAEHNEGFARALDKITAAGPYAALIGVAFSVGAQIASNHGVAAARAMGAAAPEAVVASFEAA